MADSPIGARWVAIVPVGGRDAHGSIRSARDAGGLAAGGPWSVGRDRAAGPVRLLFPGDAQIENWEYALKVAPDKAENVRRLSRVDLYKVGHHGSRNATPRILFDLWSRPDTRDRPMVAMMSTKPGVHGRSVSTAVPRKTLVAALDTRMTLLSTAELARGTPCAEVTADLDGDGVLRVVGDGAG